jgi:Ala-tRNA(Pro) deacylase
MRVTDFLDESNVKYEVTEHRPSFSAQRMAAEEHEPGRFVAKPVIVKAGGKFIMCVVSASHKVDLAALKTQLGSKSAELAKEDEMAAIFEDCELGAEPPFGNLYDLTTIIDKKLTADDHIVFQAGSHEKAIRLAMSDYMKLVEPRVLEFTYHIAATS